MDDSRLYQILGLRRGASQEEIKSAYRRLVKQLHPDLSHTPATSEQFKRVVRAYKVLSVRQVDGSCIQFPGGGRKRPSTRAHAKKEINTDALGRMVTEAKVPELRAFAVKQLGNSGKRSSYQFIRKALFDPAPLVVRSAVDAVGKLGVRQCAGELSAVFSRSDQEIRLAVLDAVGRIGGGGFSTIINLAMQDGNRAVRNRAVTLFVAGKGA
ncbi:DnaJ domain-containing protein [Sediminispirochaeta smaragdinae]|uniref:Heat shock protein DnaJ domain protein n=1 Tax=Sediminispirochaeta smaragdinae (strain DSM 11293 / JCM 15392 / SEBR 4228) TaxID=573413 RepID=E1R5V3_SEDSS|nr:DnaJ domain-containing protein [Sediminispirochaeta smaragdinae]ADK80718.1 heat shock protein DnaJ domain protein [Sediminispirochaeta smaragdinae DSM 11293]